MSWVTPMSKTILMTVIAFTVLATATIPTASACMASDPTVNYVACSSEKFDDVGAVVAYAVEGVELVLEIVDHAT